MATCRLLSLKRAQLTDEGIIFSQSKTGAGVLVEWTDELRRITERAKALKPQVPGEYLLRKRNGRPYTAWGFSAIWQSLMDKATAPGKNGEAPVLAERFTFHDLRAKCASDKDGLESAAALLGHAELADNQIRLSPQDAASDTASLKNLDAARDIRQHASNGEA